MATPRWLRRGAKAGLAAGLAGGSLAGGRRVVALARKRRQARRERVSASRARSTDRNWPEVPVRPVGPVVISAPRAQTEPTPTDPPA